MVQHMYRPVVLRQNKGTLVSGLYTLQYTGDSIVFYIEHLRCKSCIIEMAVGERIVSSTVYSVVLYNEVHYYYSEDSEVTIGTVLLYIMNV